MVISIASGKGGTGKTLLSVNLFIRMLRHKNNVTLIDLDVEEPNCDYLFNTDITNEKTIYISLPVIDNAKCKLCRSCEQVCNFNAIVVLSKKVYINKNLCHSCLRCKYHCMYNAIYEERYEIGKLNYKYNTNDNTSLFFAKGTLKEGTIQSKYLISGVKSFVEEDNSKNKNTIVIQDCPPGVSCNMTEAVKNSDIVILVTEPTPFGLHDLKLAVETVKKMRLKHYVLINKSDENDYIIENYCGKEQVEIIGKIPFSKEIYSLYAQGKNSMSIEWYDNLINSISDRLLIHQDEVV